MDMQDRQPHLLLVFVLLALSLITAGCAPLPDLVPGADLSGANLRGRDLAGLDLSGADLSGADLREARLAGTNLREANLRGANLTGADLTGSTLDWADLSDVQGLTDAMLASAASADNARLQSIEALRQIMAQACQGQGVPEADYYNAGTGPHPLVVVPEGGDAAWADSLILPDHWPARSTGNTKLVACYTTTGDGPSAQVQVRLVRAQTGETIALQNFAASDTGLVTAWLAAFVEPSG